MNERDERNLAYCIELALEREHGDASLIEAAVTESILDGVRHGYFTVPAEYAERPCVQVYVKRLRKGALYIYVSMPSLSYYVLEVEANPYEDYDWERPGAFNLYENYASKRAYRALKWDLRIQTTEDQARLYIASPPKAPPYRESVERLVTLIKTLGNIWWISLDDTTKRYMMLDMQPSKPTPPDIVERIELEMT